MYPTYDMNPIAIRKMDEERLAAMENTRPVKIQPILTAIASLGVLVTVTVALAKAAHGLGRMIRYGPSA